MLAVLGAFTGPQWDPVPVTEHLAPATSDTTIGGQPAGGADPVGTYEVRQSGVTVRLDGTTVHGVVREPVGAEGERPGVVFVHGAGTGNATGAFVDVATELASAGVVTLVPDKRLDTYTTRHRDYEQMALDYEHSVDLLRARPGVDAGRVGLYAESEGTWIAPVMAADDPGIGFVVLVSAPVVPPRQQAAFAVDSYLRNTDVPHGVFRAIPRAVGMAIPGGGFEYADFDVEPYLERLTQPVLVVYGTADPSMPIEQGANQVIDAAASGGNGAVTVRYYGGANHGIKVDDELAPGFSRDVSAWVSSLPESGTAPPQVAGAQPAQQFVAGPVPVPRWFGNGDLVVGLVVAGGVLVVLGPLVRLAGIVATRVDRTREGRVRGLAPGFGRPLLGLGLGALVTTVGLVVYLLSVARLALDYEKDAWVVQGGWLAVRLLGLATLVAAALLLNRAAEIRTARRAGATHPRHVVGGDRVVPVRIAQGATAWIMVWCVVAGSVVLLVTLAYWGVYQLGI
nr:acyl-CoA thioester hydrolase/BAAT C-terminal domain-containing protein [Cellulosimicrobium arenosum]